VKANSRISLTGTGAAAISAPLAGGAAYLGPEWALRYGAVLFAIGTVLAILLPPKVDSSEGEEPVDLTPDATTARKGLSITRPVVNALRSNSGLRLLSGFLTIFMAFTLREPPASMGWDGNATILLGLVVGGAGVGNTIGTLIGSAASSRRPEQVVIGVLVLDVAVLAGVGVFFTWWTAVILGLTVGICQSLGKLSLDALIQRDVPERVRTSMFARSETLLQLGWVTGGLLGIGLFSLDLSPQVGLLVIGALLIAWLALVVTRARRPDAPAPAVRPTTETVRPTTEAPRPTGDDHTRRF
jgi:hypothetical protein